MNRILYQLSYAAMCGQADFRHRRISFIRIPRGTGFVKHFFQIFHYFFEALSNPFILSWRSMPVRRIGYPVCRGRRPRRPARPSGAGFPKIRDFRWAVREAGPYGVDRTWCGVAGDFPFRQVVPRNGTMTVPYILNPKYAKESPVSGETGDLSQNLFVPIRRAETVRSAQCRTV